MRVDTRVTTADLPLRQSASKQGGAVFAPDLDSALDREKRGRRHELELLLERLDDCGKKMDSEPTVKHFTSWRDALAKFLQSAAGQAYRVDNLKSGGREYEIIRVINNEADRLYHVVASGAKERLKVAEALIKIRGLIVSLIA